MWWLLKTANIYIFHFFFFCYYVSYCAMQICAQLTKSGKKAKKIEYYNLYSTRKTIKRTKENLQQKNAWAPKGEWVLWEKIVSIKNNWGKNADCAPLDKSVASTFSYFNDAWGFLETSECLDKNRSLAEKPFKLFKCYKDNEIVLRKVAQMIYNYL